MLTEEQVKVQDEIRRRVMEAKRDTFLTDELREFSRKHFPDISDKQIMDSYAVLQFAMNEEKLRWKKFGNPDIEVLPVGVGLRINKYTGLVEMTAVLPKEEKKQRSWHE